MRRKAGGQTGVKPEEVAPATGIWDRANLFGDLDGLRSRLAGKGVTFGLLETSEVFGNLSGGTRRGAIYEGVTQFGIGLDTEKAFGLAGGTVNVSGYQIHSRGLSLNHLLYQDRTASVERTHRHPDLLPGHLCRQVRYLHL